MTTRALIVEDEQEILRTVEDIVRSLGHECDTAGDLETAKRCLADGTFDYIILDMNLPLAPGRLAGRRENGRNFIHTVRCMEGLAELPIVVVTAHDRGESDFIISVMQAGGMDFTKYVQKPIDGDKLDKAIREALDCRRARPRARVNPGERSADSKPALPVEPEPFVSGELVFYPNRVELCGVKILSNSGLGHSRKMLEILREKKRGRFVRVSGEELSARLGEEIAGGIGIGTITGCAKTLRSNIKKRLRKELNHICQDGDVLARDEQGYHLNDERVAVRDGIETINPARLL